MEALGEAGRGTEEGQSQTEVLLREIAENMAVLRAASRRRNRRRMTCGAATSLRSDGRDYALVKPDPPSAGIATNGTTSRRGSAGQGLTTG